MIATLETLRHFLWQSAFIRFAGVGTVATSLQFVVLTAGVEWLAMVPVVASCLGYALSSICNYLLNYYFTFSGTMPHRQTMPKFILAVFIGLSVNALIFHAAMQVLPLYLLAQAMAVAGAMMTNFLLHKHWIYRRNK